MRPFKNNEKFINVKCPNRKWYRAFPNERKHTLSRARIRRLEIQKYKFTIELIIL